MNDHNDRNNDRHTVVEHVKTKAVPGKPPEQVRVDHHVDHAPHADSNRVVDNRVAGVDHTHNPVLSVPERDELVQLRKDVVAYKAFQASVVSAVEGARVRTQQEQQQADSVAEGQRRLHDSA